jgi:long-chain-fatty-acid--[acyl-carrier-protein] ligase
MGDRPLRQQLDGPTLVLPNHPGYIDPALVLSHIRLKKPLRPLVFAGMYRNMLLRPFMGLIDAFEVPDLEEHSRDARRQTLGLIDAVVERIERGENFLIYPAGRIQRSGVEFIGAARSVSEILQRSPQVNVVLVRTRGVWGSTFSFARTGQQPDLGRCILRGVGWIIANLLLFAPRRDVSMTVEVIDRDDLPGLVREKLNRFLEDWYNQPGPETPTYVPYHRLIGPRDYDFPELETADRIDPDRIKPATIRTVNEMLEEHLGRELTDDEKRSETTLDEIGLDSLDRMDIALEIEDRFGFRSDRVASTTAELWALAEGLANASTDMTPSVPDLWNRPPSSAEPARVLAETLPEAFVRRALTGASDIAAADQLSGVLTYRRMLVAARLLSRRFAQLEGNAVGVMLPASVAADLAFWGLQVAGKLPVMMNWTTGPANLAHAVRTLDIRHVITSREFIDRLGIEIEEADCLFLEDLKGGIGKLEAARTMIGAILFGGRCLRELPRPNVDDPAVVLFTSGSESAPKAVPLSHKNLIANVRAGAAAIEMTRADTLLGFLPPFHSFGLVSNVVMPMVTGIRVVHYPDPTDAGGLVRITAEYKPTLLFTTPTFLGYMFGAAKPDDFQSLRVLVTGAEKCPEAVYVRAAEMAPGAEILEGYGITECSPVVSANRPGRTKMGTIGQALDGVEICVVDPETHEPRPDDQTGMLLVRGPSIFQGYLNYDGPDPFVQVNGKRWYRTGDLVHVDDEGFIHFRGRLKRFLKVGGEMVSLPALEEPFTQLYPPTEDGPQVAVEGIETPDGRRIVLFTTCEVSLKEANAILTEAGFRGVMRLDETRRLDQIPVLGTGKTDYKVLRKMVAETVGA